MPAAGNCVSWHISVNLIGSGAILRGVQRGNRIKFWSWRRGLLFDCWCLLSVRQWSEVAQNFQLDIKDCKEVKEGRIAVANVVCSLEDGKEMMDVEKRIDDKLACLEAAATEAKASPIGCLFEITWLHLLYEDLNIKAQRLYFLLFPSYILC